MNSFKNGHHVSENICATYGRPPIKVLSTLILDVSIGCRIVLNWTGPEDDTSIFNDCQEPNRSVCAQKREKR